ncbi:NaeI family type II restriction endonuclease [Rhodococcoides kroppenstedtii]|uniref:NaeI family type II restriction endonuclease n=1 Tax=Rhodococcoides kroppenstedtii TaxID=293050 RepID=UPI0036252328
MARCTARGRWAYQQLSKTHKTDLGTAVEVNLTKEFSIGNGSHLDWSIAGMDIDCEISKESWRLEDPQSYEPVRRSRRP